LRLTVCVLIIAVLYVLPCAASGMQAQSSTSPFCGATETPALAVQLAPRDDAPLRPDFLRFRADLQRTVAARNTDALLNIVHPNIRVAFDGAGGPEAFREYHVNNPEEDFWREFGQILALGGRFRTPAAFDAPYVFSDWPEEFDAFECLAVIGTSVRLRARPGLNGRVLGALSFGIVQLLPDQPSDPEWRHVRSADGRTGYMASRYLRSPIDHRALFEFIEGRWWLVAYVALD
jgi:hypothetical protein